MAGLVRCSCYGDEIHLRLNNVNGIPTQIPITYIFKMPHTHLAFFCRCFFFLYSLRLQHTTNLKVSLHPRALLHFFLLGKLHQQNDKTKKKKKKKGHKFKSSLSCEMYVIFTRCCYPFSRFDTGLSDVAAVLTALQNVWGGRKQQLWARVERRRGYKCEMMGEYGGRICLEDAAAWRHSEGKVKWAAAYATSLLCGCREE